MQRLSQGGTGTGQKGSQKEGAWRLIGRTAVMLGPRGSGGSLQHLPFPGAFHTLAPMTPNLSQSSPHLQGEAEQKLQLREERGA